MLKIVATALLSATIVAPANATDSQFDFSVFLEKDQVAPVFQTSAPADFFNNGDTARLRYEKDFPIVILCQNGDHIQDIDFFVDSDRVTLRKGACVAVSGSRVRFINSSDPKTNGTENIPAGIKMRIDVQIVR